MAHVTQYTNEFAHMKCSFWSNEAKKLECETFSISMINENHDCVYAFEEK